jgi:DNA-binding response OmpR family regulator
MSLVAQPLSQFNLSNSRILVLESTGLELDLYSRMLMGFGARDILKCMNLAQAEAVLQGDDVDLIIVDAKLANADGCEFVRALRSSRNKKCAFIPVLVMAGHTPRNRVTLARDCGAHFVVRKPLSPAILLERILWIAQENRPFVECDAYVGPERRFKTDEAAACAARRNGDRVEETIQNQPVTLNLSQGQGDSGFAQGSAAA